MHDDHSAGSSKKGCMQISRPWPFHPEFTPITVCVGEELRSRGEVGLCQGHLAAQWQSWPWLRSQIYTQDPERVKADTSSSLPQDVSFRAAVGICCTLMLFWAQFGSHRRKICCVLQMCANNKHASYVLAVSLHMHQGRWQNAVMQPPVKRGLYLAAYEAFSVRRKMSSWPRCSVNGSISRNKILTWRKNAWKLILIF